MKDITCTGFGFRLDIINLIRCYRPLRLIETGTYIGSGSTYIIARALRRFKLPLAVFYSIEVNPGYCEKATLFLNDKGLLDYVQIINGLSINRENLSTIEDLQKEFLDKSWPENVFVDFKVSDRARLYYRETDFDVPDDKLMECLRKFDFKPDFVFLDSGGHTGREEFRIISENLKGTCFLILDDIFHVKHYENFKYICEDKERFQIIKTSQEKFGYAIIRFTPSPVDGN